jgi:hypothetical protein
MRAAKSSIHKKQLLMILFSLSPTADHDILIPFSTKHPAQLATFQYHDEVAFGAIRASRF